jgi:hypothetical protein
LGDLLSRAWTVFKGHYGICLGMCAAAFGVLLAAYIMMYVVMFAVLAVAMATARGPGAGGGVAMLIFLPLLFCLALAVAVFVLWIILGLLRGMTSVARGQPTSIALLFSAGPYLIRATLAYLLLVLVTWGIELVAALIAAVVALLAFQGGAERMIVIQVGTYVLAIVPLILVQLTFSHFPYFIVDRNAGVWESLSLSRQITNGNKLTLFLALLLIGVLWIVVGMPTCGLAVIFAVAPFGILLHAMFYLAMSGQTTADQLRYDAWQNPPPTMAPGISPPPLPGT